VELSEKIKEIISDLGQSYVENQRTIHTACPLCNREDKFSILKDNGSSVCYRGSCDWGVRWFEEYIMHIGNMDRKSAREALHGRAKQVSAVAGQKLTLKLEDHFAPKEEQKKIDIVIPEVWPVAATFYLDTPEGQEGGEYVVRRGIPIPMAKWYGIMYSPATRRILLPIMAGKECYGWQGRAIDPVADEDRMRNNTGFRRGSLVMFIDRLKGSKHAIVAEGPFDALKFHFCGGNVATMGKVITDQQLDAILASGIEEFYTAFDDDAAKEMRELSKRLTIPLYRLVVPESARIRCKAKGKKADFGECTFDECVEAFKNPIKVDDSYLMLYLK
jgi:hypothetical protein